MITSAESVTLRPVFELAQPSVEGELLPVAVKLENGDSLLIETLRANGSVGNDGHKKTLIFQPWSDYVGRGREFNARRLEITAQETESDVLGIDNLGMGRETSNLPKDLVEQLKRGDFTEVATLMWQAVESHPEFEISPDDELTLGFHSLGTSMAAEMAAHAPEGIKVDRILLLDAAVPVERSFGSLATKYFMHGGDQLTKYLKETKELGWTNNEPRPLGRFALDVVRQRAGYHAYGRALAERPIYDALHDAYDRGSLDGGSQVHILNGSRSKISSTAENDELAQRLSSGGLQVMRTELLNETHPVNDSFPRLSAILRHVRSPTAQ